MCLYYFEFPLMKSIIFAQVVYIYRYPNRGKYECKFGCMGNYEKVLLTGITFCFGWKSNQSITRHVENNGCTFMLTECYKHEMRHCLSSHVNRTNRQFHLVGAFPAASPQQTGQHYSANLIPSLKHWRFPRQRQNKGPAD